MSDISNDIDFYTNEKIAIEAFRSYRLESGITCKKCGNNKHYWLAPKSQFQCSACRFRTTLRSGTVLEGSKLPISYFYIASILFYKHNGKVSVEEFQKATGHRYYEPLWDFNRRVRDFFDASKITMALHLYNQASK